METLVKRAEDRWNHIQKLIFSIKKMDANEFQQLRSEANSAYEDYKFLTEEADKFSNQIAEQQQKQLKDKL